MNVSRGNNRFQQLVIASPAGLQKLMPPPKTNVIHCYPSFNKQGGVERYLWELSQAQAEFCHVEILTSKTAPLPPKGPKVHRLPAPARPEFAKTLFFSLITTPYLIYWRWRHPQGIIHTQGANSLVADVITAHSCHKAWFVESLQRLSVSSRAFWLKLANPVHWVTVLIETWQYRPTGNTQIIAISQSIEKELRSYYGVAPHRICVAYNGVNTQEFSPQTNAMNRVALRKSFSLKPNEVALVFVANEFHRKGLKTLLQSMKLLADEPVTLLVAGKADPSPFKKAAESLGIGAKVNFIGVCQDVPGLFAASDIFVLPTQYEPFGLVITEAMAAGLPIIASQLAGACELIADGESGILIENPHDPVELAGHVRRLLSSTERQRIGKAGLALVQSLSWQALAEQTHSLYEKMMGAKS